MRRAIWSVVAVATVALAVWISMPRVLGHVASRAEAAAADRWRSALEAQQDSAARLARMLDVAQSENLRLSERLSGWERLETPSPGVIRVDTVVVEVTDTVVVVAEIDRRGTLDRLATDSTRVAILIPREDVGDCDLGIRITATRVDCRTPVLGHLSIGGVAGVSIPSTTLGSTRPVLGASLTYKRTLRAPWTTRVEMDVVNRRVTITSERAVRISW